MPMPLVLLLLVFWIYLAYQALLRGDTTRAMIYIAIGLALTVYRLRKREASPR
jgi:hypothetical protein